MDFTVEYEGETFFVQGRFVDAGIGPYEFWGARGNDSRKVFECESVQNEAGDGVVWEDYLLEAIIAEADMLRESEKEYLNK